MVNLGNPPPGHWEQAEREMDRMYPTIDLSIVHYLRNNSEAEFEYVSLGGMRKDGDPPRYFIADLRTHHENEPWVCIHQWTASPASLLRNLNYVWDGIIRWEHVHDRIWVFEARNKGQIAAWLEDSGYITKFMGQRPAVLPAQERITVNSRDRQIAREQEAIARAQARIDRLMDLPAEPTTDDPDNALVVWFTHRFNPRGQKYTYAAVKAGDGKWYTTGPASPKGYTWDQLVEWHFTEANEGNPMWLAEGWEELV